MHKSHIISSEVLKAGDIRGIVGEELTKIDAYYIGRGYGTLMSRKGKTNCVIGQDGRLSSDSFREEAIRGLRDSGLNAVFIGIVPTPMVYHIVKTLDIGAGIMITASHNPPEYNGFKFLTNTGLLPRKELKLIAAISESGDFTEGHGTYKEEDFVVPYITYLLSFLTKPDIKDLTIVWDPGNGAAAPVLPDFTKGIPGTHKIICGKIDGNFPNHHPDPSRPENVQQLITEVINSEADMGIAFDGDGDRIGVVDGKGRLLNGDQLLVILAKDFLKTYPGSRVMTEVKASQFFFEAIRNMGGEPLMWKVGHINQKEKMLNDNIELAGETSGHIFYKENYGFDDPFFAAIKLINYIKNQEKSLTEIVDEFPKYFDSGEIRITLPKEDRDKIIEEIKERLKASKREHINIDGIRVQSTDGFWMLRNSNTQPQLTVRCEATSKSGLINLIKEIENEFILANIKSDEFTSILCRLNRIENL